MYNQFNYVLIKQNMHPQETPPPIHYKLLALHGCSIQLCTISKAVLDTKITMDSIDTLVHGSVQY